MMMRVIWLALLGLPALSAFSTMRPTRFTRRSLNLVPELHDVIVQSAHHLGDLSHHIQQSSLVVADAAAPAVDAGASLYSKVDKTGFIGGIAEQIENAIDFGRGVVKSYGLSIILFTCLLKVVTLPLTQQQLESTTKMQKLAPLQKTIQEKYAEDEVTKNKLLSQLFQAANVNPLAGCLPALVQIPIFISLYRALTNLVAENKLQEPFLWIPSLEGPIYDRPTAEAADWLKSIFAGNPLLGWHDTLAFLSLPLILYISQSISQKVLAPPKDPNKVLSEQEQVTQGVVNNLPFIVAFFLNQCARRPGSLLDREQRTYDGCDVGCQGVHQGRGLSGRGAAHDGAG
mmetsp:Transcript_8338/g.18672  ORF Transcript_8338/g.18672 Transcript_8338/m.18672 type:complete len:343 (-) Transcript_8338:173-1201(-)